MLTAIYAASADVVISFLDEVEDAEDTAKWVRQAGRKALVVAGDITRESLCRDLVERTVRELGSIDILVNNAAFQRTYADVGDITVEEWDRTFRTNIYAPFFLSKSAVPFICAQAVRS